MRFFPRLKNLMIRIIALTLLFSFSLDQTLVKSSFAKSNFASLPQSPANSTEHHKDTLNIFLPKEIGEIKSSYLGAGNKLVIHIQDAHVNEEAQRNISEILNYFVETKNLRLVNIEGAEGLLFTEYFSSFTNDEARKLMADYYLREGRMTGAEYLAIVKQPNLRLYGIEDMNLYRQNRRAYLKSISGQENLENSFSQLFSLLQGIARYVLSSQQRMFIELNKKFNEDPLSAYSYLQFLIKIAEERNVTLASFERIKNFMEISKLPPTDRTLDLSQLFSEVKRVVPPEKAPKLYSLVFDYQAEKISKSIFLDRLQKELVVILDKSPQKEKLISLRSRISLARLYESLDGEIFEEIESLSDLVSKEVFTDKDSLEIFHMFKVAALSKRMCEFNLSRSDADFYNRHMADFSEEYFNVHLAPLLKKFHFDEDAFRNWEWIDSALEEAENFYHLALKRDKVLVQNSIDQLEKSQEKIAAVVAGGFHTPGIEAYLRQKNISYVVVAPRVSKEIDQRVEEKNYRSAVADDELSVQRMLIKGGFLSDPKFQLVPELITPVAGKKPTATARSAFGLVALLSLFFNGGNLDQVVPTPMRANPYIAQGLQPLSGSQFKAGNGYKLLAHSGRGSEGGTVFSLSDHPDLQRAIATNLEHFEGKPFVELPSGQVVVVYDDVPPAAFERAINLQSNGPSDSSLGGRIDRISRAIGRIAMSPGDFSEAIRELGAYERELNLIGSRSEVRLSAETLDQLKLAQRKLSDALEVLGRLDQERQTILADANALSDGGAGLRQGLSWYSPDEANSFLIDGLREVKAGVTGNLPERIELKTLKERKEALAFLKELGANRLLDVSLDLKSLEGALGGIDAFLSRFASASKAVRRDASAQKAYEGISREQRELIALRDALRSSSEQYQSVKSNLTKALEESSALKIMGNYFLRAYQSVVSKKSPSPGSRGVNLGAGVDWLVRHRHLVLAPTVLLGLALIKHNSPLPQAAKKPVVENIAANVSNQTPLANATKPSKSEEEKLPEPTAKVAGKSYIFPMVAQSSASAPIRDDLYPDKPRLGDPDGKNGFYEARRLNRAGTFSDVEIGTGGAVFTKNFTLQDLIESREMRSGAEVIRKNPILVVVADPNDDGFNVLYDKAALIWKKLGPSGLQVILVVPSGQSNKNLAVEKHLKLGEKVPVVVDSQGIWSGKGIGFFRPGHGWIGNAFKDNFPSWTSMIRALQNWRNESPSDVDNSIVLKSLDAETIAYLAKNELSLDELIALLHSDPNATRQLWKPSSAREEQFSMIHEDLKGLPESFSTEFGLLEKHIVEYCNKMGLPVSDPESFYPLDFYLNVFKPLFIVRQYGPEQAGKYMQTLVAIAQDERARYLYEKPVSDKTREWFEGRLKQYRRLAIESLTRTPRSLDPRYRGNWKIWAMKTIEEKWLINEENKRSGVSFWGLLGLQLERATEAVTNPSGISSLHDRAIRAEKRLIQLFESPVAPNTGGAQRINAWKAVYDPVSHPGFSDYSRDLEIMMALYHDAKDINLFRHPSILRVDQAINNLVRTSARAGSAGAARNPQKAYSGTPAQWKDSKAAMRELAKVPGFKEWFGAVFNPEEARLRAEDPRFKQRSARLQKFLSDMKYSELFLNWLQKLLFVWPNTFGEGKVRSGQPETVRKFSQNFDALLNIKPGNFTPGELEDLVQITGYDLRGLDLSFYGDPKWYDAAASDRTKLGVRQVAEPVAPMSADFLLRGVTAQQQESLTRIIADAIAHEFPVPPFTLALDDPKTGGLRDRNPILSPVVSGPLEALSARGYIYTNFGIGAGSASTTDTVNDFRLAILLNPDMWRSGPNSANLTDVVYEQKTKGLIEDFKFLSEQDYFKQLYEEDYGTKLIDFIKLLSLGRIGEKIRFSPQGYVVYGFDYLQEIENEVINALLTEEGRKLLLSGKSNEVSGKHFKTTFPPELRNYLWGVVQTKPSRDGGSTEGLLGVETSYQLKLSEYYNDFAGVAVVGLKNIYYPTIFATIFSARSEGINDPSAVDRHARLKIYAESRIAIRKAVKDFYEGQGAKGNTFSLIHPKNVGRLSGLADRVRDGVPPEVLAIALEIAADKKIQSEALELYNLLNEFEGKDKLTKFRVLSPNETDAGNDTAFLLWWASKRIDEEDVTKWAKILGNKDLMAKIKALGDAFWDINGAFLDEKPSSSFTEGNYRGWDRKKKGMFSAFLEQVVEQSFPEVSKYVNQSHQYWSKLKPSEKAELISEVKKDALYLLYGVTLDEKWNPDRKGKFDFTDLQTALIQKGFLSSWAFHHLGKYSESPETAVPSFQWDGFISSRLLADTEVRKQIFELAVRRWQVRLIYLNENNPLPSKEQLLRQAETIVREKFLGETRIDDLLPYLPELNGALLSLMSGGSLLDAEGDIMRDQVQENLRVLAAVIESEEARALNPARSRPGGSSSRSEVRRHQTREKLNVDSFFAPGQFRNEQRVLSLLAQLSAGKVDWQSPLAEFMENATAQNIGISLPEKIHSKNYLLLEVNSQSGMTPKERQKWVMQSVLSMTRDPRFGKGLEVVVFVDPSLKGLQGELSKEFSQVIKQGFLKIKNGSEKQDFVNLKLQELDLEGSDVYHLLLDMNSSRLRRQADSYVLRGALGLARGVGICIATDDLSLSGSVSHEIRASSLMDAVLAAVQIGKSA